MRMVSLLMLIAIVLWWIECKSRVNRNGRGGGLWRMHMLVMIHVVLVRMVEGDGRGVVGMMLVVRALRIIVRIAVGHRGETDWGRDKPKISVGGTGFGVYVYVKNRRETERDRNEKKEASSRGMETRVKAMINVIRSNGMGADWANFVYLTRFRICD